MRIMLVQNVKAFGNGQENCGPFCLMGYMAFTTTWKLQGLYNIRMNSFALSEKTLATKGSDL